MPPFEHATHPLERSECKKTNFLKLVKLMAQVGALTMDLIDLEIKRTEHRAAEEGISPAMVAQKALDAATGSVQLNERWACMLNDSC